MNLKTSITLDFPNNRIRVHNSSLRVLQFPDYIRLLVNPMEKIIALQISDGEDSRSQRLLGRYGKSKDRIDLCSKELMEKLLLCGDWDLTKTYRFQGIPRLEEGMIIYPISGTPEHSNSANDTI